MPDDKKDFFNIAKMTQAFREGKGELDGNAINLAIAQQLAVISGSLSRIAEALEEAFGRAKKS